MSSPSPFPTLALALLGCVSLACSDAYGAMTPGSTAPGSMALPRSMTPGSLAQPGGTAQPESLDAPLDCSRAGHGGRPFTTCDIAERACQQRIAEIAACQWGGSTASVVRPSVNTLSEEQYRAQLRGGAVRDERSLALRSAVDASLAQLGLIDGGELSPESIVERNAEGVLAYYDPASKSVTVIDRGSGTNQPEANATLLHEMIHALQDGAHDLESLRGSAATSSSDGDLALRSLVEGEAKFHDLLFTASLSGEPLTPELLRQRLAQRRVLSEEVLFEGGSVLTSSLQSVPYLYGPEWILERWLAGGSEALRAQYEAVPGDLLGLLQSSWSAERELAEPSAYPAPNVYTTGAEPAEGSELLPLAYDRLGAYTVYTAARLAGGAAAGQQLALSWRGDQLDVYELDAGGAAARWHVELDSAQHAASFANLLARNANVSVRHRGSSVVGVVSESGSKPEWLFGPLAR